MFTFSIDANVMTGTILSEIGLLTSLSDLSMNDNEFTGTLPSEIRLLKNLTFIGLCKSNLYIILEHVENIVLINYIHVLLTVLHSSIV